MESTADTSLKIMIADHGVIVSLKCQRNLKNKNITVTGLHLLLSTYLCITFSQHLSETKEKNRDKIDVKFCLMFAMLNRNNK